METKQLVVNKLCDATLALRDAYNHLEVLPGGASKALNSLNEVSSHLAEMTGVLATDLYPGDPAE